MQRVVSVIAVRLFTLAQVAPPHDSRRLFVDAGTVRDRDERVDLTGDLSQGGRTVHLYAPIACIHPPE